MAAPISADRHGVRPGPVVPLFQVPFVGSSSLGTLARNQYDVTADGERSLVNLPSMDPSTIPITVVVNWMQALA